MGQRMTFDYEAMDRAFAEAGSCKSAFSVASSVAERMGFPYIIYAPIRNHPDAEQTWSATTYPPEWQDMYITKEYLPRNPVRAHATKSSRPFLWSDLERQLPKENRGLFADSRAVGMREGVVVPIHGPWGQLVTIGFSTPDGHAIHDSVVQALQVVAVRLHQASGVLAPQQAIRLTPREMEILDRVATGASSCEVAHILGISENSVEWHMKNLYRKLGVRNRVAAVTRAIQLGLFTT